MPVDNLLLNPILPSEDSATNRFGGMFYNVPFFS